MPSRYTSTCSWASPPELDVVSVTTAMSGWMVKSSGRIAIPATSERLRRYSRSSLRMMARTRRRLTLISARLRVLVDELQVDILERMARLGDREDVGAGGDQRPGRGRRRPASASDTVRV